VSPSSKGPIDVRALATWKHVHEFLEQLPEAEFDPGGRVFSNGVVRVKGKVVAYPAGGSRGTPEDAKEGEEFVFVKARSSEREALMHEDPHTFFVTPHYAGAPGVIVRLSTVDQAQLKELLIDAWRIAAPKKVLRQYDERG
jgi:hypothetical protein